MTTTKITFLLIDGTTASYPYSGPVDIEAAFDRYRQVGLSEGDLARVDIYGAPEIDSPEASKRHGLLFSNVYRGSYDRWAIDPAVNDAIAAEIAS